MNKKNIYILLVSFLAFLTFIALFVSRALDDNRLTSWQWTFEGIGAAKVFIIIVSGILAAYLLLRLSLLDRYPVISLFSFSYVISILFWREPEVIVDASRYFTQAKHLEVYGAGYFLREWGKNISAWTDMPLMSFIYGLIFKFLGETRLYIQMLTSLFFSATVVLTYKVGRTLWDEETGLLAGLFILGIPYLFIQVPLMLIDVPSMFFLMLSVLTFIKALETGGRWICLASLSLSLAFYSKYSTWLMLSVLGVIFLVYLIRKPEAIHPPPFPSLPGRVNGGVVTSTFFYRGSVTFLMSALLIGIAFLYKFDIFSEQIRLLLDYQKPGLQRWSESYISTFFFQIHPFITAGALYSIYAAFKKRDLKYIIVCWLVLLTIFLQIKRIRYSIMVFPMLSLMAAYGIKAVEDKDLRRFSALCAVASSIILSVFVFLPFTEKMSAVNLREAGKFLDSINEPAVRVYALEQKDPVINPAVSVPILDIFTKKRIYFNYKPVRSDLEKIQSSSLRFTWEQKHPEYYTGPQPAYAAIAVISDDTGDAVPEEIKQELKGYRLAKKFHTYEGVFRYRTYVRIYRK